MRGLHKAVLAAALLAAAGFPASAQVSLSAASSTKLWLEGDSTLHPYKIAATRFLIDMTLDQGEGEAISGAVRAAKAAALTVTIPVAAMKSDHSRLDKNMRKAMKADEHQNVIFVLGGYAVSPAADGAKIAASGTLTIAGVSKPVTINAGAAEKNGLLIVDGEHPVLMSDYGIAPPKMMLGAVRTADKIVVKYHLELSPVKAAGAQGER